MVLSVLFFVLGFCCAALCAVLFAPLVWNRAVRLTRLRAENALPLTLKDIRAERDNLRADFAVTGRRLELDAERARESEAEARAEIGRNLTKIDDLTHELETWTERFAEAEALIEGSKGELGEAEASLEATDQALAEARTKIDALNVEVEQLGQQLAGRNAENDGQRVEIVALKTLSDNLSDKLEEKSLALADLKSHFSELQSARRTAAARVASLERSLQAKDREISRLGKRHERLETDHAGILERLQKESERKADEIRDLQSRFTVQSGELSRLGKKSADLEQQVAIATDELARVEAILEETEQRTAAEVESALEALEAERTRRGALAAQLAELTGKPAADEPADRDSLTEAAIPAERNSRRLDVVRPRPRGHTVAARQMPVANAQVGANASSSNGLTSVASRVVKPSSDGFLPNTTDGVTNKSSSVFERISKLHTRLGGSQNDGDVEMSESSPVDPQGAGEHETEAARKSSLMSGLSDSELQARIRDLADKFAVFDLRGRRGARATGAGFADPTTQQGSSEPTTATPHQADA